MESRSDTLDPEISALESIGAETGKAGYRPILCPPPQFIVHDPLRIANHRFGKCPQLRIFKV